MEFIKTDIPDVLIIQPKIFGDDRGYFVETFRQNLFEKAIGYKVNLALRRLVWNFRSTITIHEGFPCLCLK